MKLAQGYPAFGVFKGAVEKNGEVIFIINKLHTIEHDQHYYGFVVEHVPGHTSAVRASSLLDFHPLDLYCLPTMKHFVSLRYHVLYY